MYIPQIYYVFIIFLTIIYQFILKDLYTLAEYHFYQSLSIIMFYLRIVDKIV